MPIDFNKNEMNDFERLVVFEELEKYRDGVVRKTVKFYDDRDGCYVHILNPNTGRALCGVDTGLRPYDIFNVFECEYIDDIDCQRCLKISEI